MTAMEADFYSAAIQDPDNYYNLPVEESPYLPLYQHVVNWVPRGIRTVVDLGCGSGRLAKLLCSSRPELAYLGLDFSTEMIERAEAYNIDTPGTPLFVLNDLRYGDEVPAADLYLAIEVLEHLDDDLGLLAKLPKHSHVVLSVPNFDSEAHVRYFDSWAHCWTRYSNALIYLRQRTLVVPGSDGDVDFYIMHGLAR
jgi:trans-aconitate methyltransferase